MFSKILVANRGEIALRVLRACRELGIGAVAVYSEADRDAPWLDGADEARLIGPAPAAESYLHVERLIEAAQASGAEAIHPGYGFLSESTDLVGACDAAGITWIGPPASAIEQMGDKLSARAVAQRADVPVVPGTMEPTTDPEVVRAFAAEHGFPVAIKAAYGGGGRGMKVVEHDGDLADALEAAQRESKAAFGRDEVYVERYLRRPRHVEAQVLADRHGNVLFVGERDCSTQRRHQKLIEEAPAPGFPEEVRARLAEASRSVSREVGYVGAGTVECLYEDGDFYFLEMNTRLQVEHPVTEMVTGQDLVHWQIRIAAGEELTLTEADLTPRGHAIEARINAEDPGAGFVPSPGLITSWREPAGPGVRLDAGARAGWEIPRDYDSMIAKLVAHGADREQARRRLLRALDELEVGGVPTTVAFHRLALAHPDFAAGDVSTVSVEREWDLSALQPADPAEQGEGPAEPARSLTVEIDGRRVRVEVFDPLAGAATAAAGAPRRGRRGRDRRQAAGPSAGGDTATLAAPMQGTIVKTSVAVGDEVAAGDPVVVLEAMKMENQVAAHRDGTVTEVHVEPGSVVNAGDALLTIDGGQAAGAED